MTLEPQHKDYLIKHKDDIDKGDWESFFSMGYPVGIGATLYKASIPFMQKLQFVPTNAFTGSNIDTVIIPEGVKKIDTKSFYACSCTEIAIPKSVTSIGFMAFYLGESSRHIYINDLDAWCNIAFDGMLANPLYNLGKLYLNNKLVTDLVIPSSITNINPYAFSGCYSLKSVTIPRSVTQIREGTFNRCHNIQSVLIPDSVTSIGENAFSSCESLASLKIPNSVTLIDARAFNNISNDLVINYDGTKEQWKKICHRNAFEFTYFTVNCIDGQIVKKRKK